MLKIMGILTCLLAVTACGTPSTSSASQHAVTITIHDNYFSPDAITVPPLQPVKITLVNVGVNVHIVEIKGLTPEAPLQPGQSATFTVTPQARAYQIYDEIYVVDGMTGTFSGGSGTAVGAATPVPIATLTQAVAVYRTYALDQATNLVSASQQFTDAVQLGNLATAEKLYPLAHQYYERIEPIAEQFPALDTALDARINAVPMAQWQGFHRLEYALWSQGTTAGLTAIAQQLLTNVEQLHTILQTVQLTPRDIIDGAVALLDEAGHTKITGEEDRYSHTDLYDLTANVEGAHAAFEVFHTYMAGTNPALLSEVETRFGAVEATLSPYRQGSGFVAFTSLSATDTRAIAQAIDAVAEPLTQVGGQLPA